MKRLSAALMFLFAFSACTRDPMTKTPPLDGSFNVQVMYVFGHDERPLALEQQMVHPMTGDTMTFTKLQYFVSNIKLRRTDGSWWAVPESYHLLSAESVDMSTIKLSKIPYGNYTAMEYTMGVDSTRNVSGAQTGALSLQNGMFWDWLSGYIMMKAEGRSPNSPTGTFAIHLGGFSGTNNIVTTKTAEFGKTIQIGNYAPVLTATLVANPARLWHSSPGLSIRSTIHMPGPAAVTMAKDFYNAIYLSGLK